MFGVSHFRIPFFLQYRLTFINAGFLGKGLQFQDARDSPSPLPLCYRICTVQEARLGLGSRAVTGRWHFQVSVVHLHASLEPVPALIRCPQTRTHYLLSLHQNISHGRHVVIFYILNTAYIKSRCIPFKYLTTLLHGGQSFLRS
jgi:hypothetical protein